MPATPFDSALYGGLFAEPEIRDLFSETAELRAMLTVEGALAHAQAQLGMIPAEAAAQIDQVCQTGTLDPEALGAATATNGVPVPALVAALRGLMAAPDQAAFVHWGATSQDIVDTGLALRLRDVVRWQDAALRDTLDGLARLADIHRATPMAGRTWGLAATPTSFGAVVASWGRPLMRARLRLEALQDDLLAVSLAGAAGTLSAWDPMAPRCGL